MEANTAPDRLIGRREVEEILGVKTTALYAGMRRGTIPRPVRLGPRCLRWSRRALLERISELEGAGDGARRAS